MSHMIVKGIDRVICLDANTVWHRDETLKDGRLIEMPFTVGEDGEAHFLRMTGALWNADHDNDVFRLAPIQVVDEETGLIVPVTTHQATLSRTGRVLGIVTDGYTALSGKTVCTELVLSLIRAGAVAETLGTFDAGANMFCSMRVTDDFFVPGDHSATRSLYNVLANHAGVSAVQGMLSTVRIVCSNTARMFSNAHALNTDQDARNRNAWVYIRHTLNAVDRMRQAAEWIANGRARAESEQAFLAKLAAKTVSKTEVDKFIERYISIPDDASKKMTTHRERERLAFDEVLRDVADLGNHALGGDGISAYGLLQAVTRYEDWKSPVRVREKDKENTSVATRRAFRAFKGEREPEKTEARLHIAEMVGVELN